MCKAQYDFLRDFFTLQTCFLIGVCEDVLIEVVLLSKLFPTLLTFMVSDTGVGEGVAHEGELNTELLGAHRALIIPDTGVCQDVFAEVGLLRELLAAHRAFKISDASVGDRVSGEVALEAEGLATHLTLQLPLHLLDGGVRGEVLLLLVPAAHVAFLLRGLHGTTTLGSSRPHGRRRQQVLPEPAGKLDGVLWPLQRCT